MADFVFDQGLGSVVERVRDGANIIAVVLEAAEVDGTLRGYTALSTLLAAAGNTEWGATGYSRHAVANASITVDDVGSPASIDIPDWTWTGVSGATASVRLIICQDGVDDTARIPLTAYDFAVTPDGTDVNVSVNAAGLYTAAG